MKTHYLVLLNAVSLACFAQKSEEEAIKKLLVQEASSYYHKNYDQWANTWAHDTASYLIAASTTSKTELRGWSAIAASRKQNMNNLALVDESLIAPQVNRTDHNIFINGNTAIVTCKDETAHPSFYASSLVKQNGNWKILNRTIIVSGSYGLLQSVATLRNIVGTWEMEPGSLKSTPAETGNYKYMRFDINETSFGFALVATWTYTNSSGNTFNAVPRTEIFIPDNGQMEVLCTDIRKDRVGRTYTNPGKFILNDDGSFTIRCVYNEKPAATSFEFTVNLKDGKWYQTTNAYAMDGKLSQTTSVVMNKVMSTDTHAF